MNLPPFESFPSIPRLKRTCCVSEKLDGSNAQIYIPDDSSFVAAGSRNRWITPQDDNYGFAKWVEEHKEELLALGPGKHFGEWYGAGIQRRYGLQEKRFALFNTARWLHNPRPACCGVVPLLYEGEFTSTVVDETLQKLATEGSVAAPGFMNPEGVVVYLPASQSYFKVTLGGDGHKGAKKS
jgi:hypothetical protein